MAVIDTEAEATVLRYANWIGIMAVCLGVTTIGMLLFVEHLFGWTGPAASAANMASGLLTGFVGAYPFMETMRARGGWSPIRFRTYVTRIIALAVGSFVLQLILNSRQ
jgi:hypothetical protein